MGVERSGGGGTSKLPAVITARLRPVIETIAELVQRDAQISITTGAVSGKAHVPSAPGTAPNNDTGDLANGIIVQHVEPLTARIVSTAAHGAIQELGGSTGTAILPERPYLRPAIAKNREAGKRLMEAAVRQAVREV